MLPIEVLDFPEGHIPASKLNWYDLYSGKARSKDADLYSASSTRHPAKMSLPLCRRIIAEMLSDGRLRIGSVLGDPFGGRGATALEWCALNPANRAWTTEIEEHFCRMQMENKAVAKLSFEREFEWEILRADSRFLHQVLKGEFSSTRALLDQIKAATRLAYEAEGYAEHGTLDALYYIQQRDGICEPGYVLIGARPASDDYDQATFDEASPVGTPPNPGKKYEWPQFYPKDRVLFAAYDRATDAVAGSPPYGKGVIGAAGKSEKSAARLRALTQDPGSSLYGRDPNGEWFQAMTDGYRPGPGNVDLLPSDADLAAVSSPTYGNSQIAPQGAGTDQSFNKAHDEYKRTGDLSVFKAATEKQRNEQGYGATPGQVGLTRDDGSGTVISSPTYAGSLASEDRPVKHTPEYLAKYGHKGLDHENAYYGTTPGQTGRLKDDGSETVISSPTYPGVEVRQAEGSIGKAWNEKGERAREQLVNGDGGKEDIRFYGTTPGQLGKAKDTGEESVSTECPICKANDLKFISRKSVKCGSCGISLKIGAIVPAAPKRAQVCLFCGGLGSADGCPDCGKPEWRLPKLTDEVKTSSVISSAPYEESLSSDDPVKRGGLFKDPKRANDPTLTANYRGLGDAVVASAPFEGSLHDDGHSGPEGAQARRDYARANGIDNVENVSPIDFRRKSGYSNSAVVSSAPFEAQSGGHPEIKEGPLSDPKLHERHAASRIGEAGGYAGNVDGQVGVMKGQTYAIACLEIYRSMAMAGIRHVCLVTKNPVSKGELRRLDRLTVNLMDAAGYDFTDYRRAWLWETVDQLAERGIAYPRPEKPVGKLDQTFWEKWGSRPVGSLSFFHVIHLSNGKRPPAQYEDCLFFTLR